MIDSITIDKTLRDNGLLELKEDGSSFYSSVYPEITGKIIRNSKLGGVQLSFDDFDVNEYFGQLAEIRSISQLAITEDDLMGLVDLFYHNADVLSKMVQDNERFEESLEISLADTEAERQTKERRGQEKYKERMKYLWNNSCAVTGIRIPELLKASHAMAWKDCKNGKDRLNPYNGFLLSANLDALFDAYLISFDETGKILISPSLCWKDLLSAGITNNMRLRFIREEHKPYLSHHRAIFYEKARNPQKMDYSNRETDDF